VLSSGAECPDGESLCAFAENRAQGAEQEEIAAHVMKCSRCGELYLRLVQFSQADEELGDEEWERAKKRLGNWLYAFLNAEEERSRRWAVEGARRVADVRRGRRWWELPKFEWAVGFAAVIVALVGTMVVFMPGTVTEMARKVMGREESGERTAEAEANIPTLQEQLDAQYHIVKIDGDEESAALMESATLLSVQKGGILGVPYDDPTNVPTKYEVEESSGDEFVLKKASLEEMRGGAKELARRIPIGGDVYPTKILVDTATDKVVMGIVACEKCKKNDPATYVKATVIFQFPKGSLDTKVVGPVEDTIGKVLCVEGRRQEP
jgi:hypothetical protein